MSRPPAAATAAASRPHSRGVSRAAPSGGAGGRAGFAMLVALFVLFLVSMTLSLVGMSLAVRLRTAHEEARSATLTALCDAALAEALAGLAISPSATGLSDHPFGGGIISSQVAMVVAQQYRITATATFAGRSRTVEADVVRDAQGTRVQHWQRLPG